MVPWRTLDSHRSRGLVVGALTAAFLVGASVRGQAQAVQAQAVQGTGAALGTVARAGTTAVQTTDAEGRVTLRATRTAEPIKIDGRLDEAVYSQTEPISGLIQLQPDDGEPVSEKTEAWIFFDDQNVYVACRCWHRDPKTMVLDDMRRDVSNNGDYFSISFDTFHDRRNSYLFYVNPMGGIMDVLTTDERNRNNDWNGVWHAAGGRFDGGWVGEIAIPFKTLRYNPGKDQTWGVMLRRRIRQHGDEHAFLPRMPRVYGPGAIVKMSMAAPLVGIEAPPASLSLELKPYAIAKVSTDLQAASPYRNDFDGDVGFDAKYGLTKGLSADFTYNTDFAQVEADQAQVNLTRFSLFFPEKREFFLEGQGIFQFGGAGAGGGGGGGANASGDSVVPVMFFSRRIGLQGASAVPIVAGGRINGRAGGFGLGALSITTDDIPEARVQQTNFSVLRAQRPILRRSAIGALMTHRSAALASTGSNQLIGADGLFSFFESLNFNTYMAKSYTDGAKGDDLSYRAQLDYDGDRYGLQLEHLGVGDNFNPEVGFMRRQDFRRSYGQARFSPRPRGARLVRRYNYELSLDYITDNDNVLETRNLEGTFRTEFHSSNSITVQYNRLFELIEQPFTITEGVRVPVGAYDFQNVRVAYTMGQQQKLSGTAAAERGGFYDGDKTTASFQGRFKTNAHFAVEPNVSLNWIDLPQGSFLTKVVSARTTYNFSPRMFVAALLQYSSTSSSFSTNIRFRWEYQPGSDVFFVYTEGRDTFPADRTPLENRGFVVKFNRLLRF